MQTSLILNFRHTEKVISKLKTYKAEFGRPKKKFKDRFIKIFFSFF